LLGVLYDVFTIYARKRLPRTSLDGAAARRLTRWECHH
jgi:hypothetical protein